VQSLRRLTIGGRAGLPVAVDSHTIPVMDNEGSIRGAVLLLHDASSEISLEERCQSLHEKATRDPMTQVANRAEFDRVHQMFINAHRERQVPCSLMICDLDHFKQVNDHYGHQAGDEAIISLATLLKKHCRPGDLVARYGGEEFVTLFAGCDNATAARRAEQIRKALSEMPQAKMLGRTVTASFGVTEIQPGDTAETMLRRADRALLMAKSRGRNTVVQLGSGSGGEEETRATEPVACAPSSPEIVLRRELLTPVPTGVALEKLRGFIADHQAKIISVEGNCIRLELNKKRWLLRRGDRRVPLAMTLRFEEERCQAKEPHPEASPPRRTRIEVTIAPKKNRDRHRSDVELRAREFLASLRCYLMAAPESPGQSGEVIRRTKSLLAPWIIKR
jgi:diguanylate cyclase (GGDEF)-like protein